MAADGEGGKGGGGGGGDLSVWADFFLLEIIVLGIYYIISGGYLLYLLT
jgi:hypothetical protein